MIDEEIKGQERVKDLLLTALKNDKLANTLLFIGPAGVGKSLMAKFLAKCVNCLNDDFTCCNQCTACKRIENMNYPDVHWVQKDNSGTIKIEQVRQLETEIQMRPYEARSKVFIIEEAQGLTAEASNALLKTLEEPPGDSLIILTTVHADQLFPTIRSRCQKFFFLPLEVESLKEILIKDYGLKENLAHFAAYFSGGSIGRALRFSQEDILKRKNQFVNNFLGSFSRNEYFDKDFFADREGLREGLEFLINWFRDILMLKMGLGSGYLVNSDREKDLLQSQERYSFDELQDILGEIIMNLKLLQQNVNSKITFFTLRARLCPGSSR